MEPHDLLRQARLELFDTARPYLWSDGELYSYINDAQVRFARGTWGISDASSSITTVPYTTASDWVTLDRSILRIRGVNDSVTGAIVKRIKYEDMETLGIRFDLQPGRLRYLVVGMERNKARLHPFPESDGSLSLIVDRMPLTIIEGCGGSFEIDAHHHVNLLLWVKARAYSKEDTETFNKGKASEFATLFDAYVSDSRIEKERNVHTPRGIPYGGI